MKSIPFFQSWPDTRLLDLNDDMCDKTLMINEMVYEIGTEASAFYVVVEGKIVLETCIEIDTYNKFPCSAKEW